MQWVRPECTTGGFSDGGLSFFPSWMRRGEKGPEGGAVPAYPAQNNVTGEEEYRLDQPESILEGLRDFFYGCPLLEGGQIRLEYLGAEPTGYSIETQETSPVLRQYVSGDSLRQLVFVLASREAYGPEQQKAMSGSGFYEQLAGWIEEQNRQGKLPLLPEGCRPQRLEVLTCE